MFQPVEGPETQEALMQGRKLRLWNVPLAAFLVSGPLLAGCPGELDEPGRGMPGGEPSGGTGGQPGGF